MKTRKCVVNHDFFHLKQIHIKWDVAVSILSGGSDLVHMMVCQSGVVVVLQYPWPVETWICLYPCLYIPRHE